MLQVDILLLIILLVASTLSIIIYTSISEHGSLGTIMLYFMIMFSGFIIGMAFWVDPTAFGFGATFSSVFGISIIAGVASMLFGMSYVVYAKNRAYTRDMLYKHIDDDD